jgi:hypothetical protein
VTSAWHERVAAVSRTVSDATGGPFVGLVDVCVVTAETWCVQDRYAADVGDFIKLGLLRHLAGPSESGGAALVIGVNWYLTPDEAHNQDGKHVSYLHATSAQHNSLRACDPDLMERLGRVVAEGRSVEALERLGALPDGCRTFREPLQR